MLIFSFTEALGGPNAAMIGGIVGGLLALVLISIGIAVCLHKNRCCSSSAEDPFELDEKPT